MFFLWYSFIQVSNCSLNSCIWSVDRRSHTQISYGPVCVTKAPTLWNLIEQGATQWKVMKFMEASTRSYSIMFDVKYLISFYLTK